MPTIKTNEFNAKIRTKESAKMIVEKLIELKQDEKITQALSHPDFSKDLEKLNKYLRDNGKSEFQKGSARPVANTHENIATFLSLFEQGGKGKRHVKVYNWEKKDNPNNLRPMFSDILKHMNISEINYSTSLSQAHKFISVDNIKISADTQDNSTINPSTIATKGKSAIQKSKENKEEVEQRQKDLEETEEFERQKVKRIDEGLTMEKNFKSELLKRYYNKLDKYPTKKFVDLLDKYNLQDEYFDKLMQFGGDDKMAKEWVKKVIKEKTVSSVMNFTDEQLDAWIKDEPIRKDEPKKDEPKKDEPKKDEPKKVVVEMGEEPQDTRPDKITRLMNKMGLSKDPQEKQDIINETRTKLKAPTTSQSVIKYTYDDSNFVSRIGEMFRDYKPRSFLVDDEINNKNKQWADMWNTNNDFWKMK
eukprot:PhM_4_TR2094/c4_g1_i1/m.20467